MLTASNVGRVAVVSGANKGIGFFIALQLGLSGYFSHVIVACRNETRGLAAVANMQEQLRTVNNAASAEILYAPLEIGNAKSHSEFADKMERDFGKVDVLVNNAAIAYKGSDPTPFVQQCTPTLDINYRGTVDFTDRMMPLVKKGNDPRIVTVASMSGHLSHLRSKKLQDQFTSASLTFPALNELVEKFESDVKSGAHVENGWGNSNYGMSKLAIIAATKIWARDNPSIAINCCCPGYCKTDMSSHKGRREPSEGSRNAVIPATMENPPTGQFFKDFAVGKW